MERTRILMTADTVGGVWTYAVELARALTSYPCEVVLATMGGHLGAADLRALAHTSHLMLYESSYRLEWMDDPWDEVDEAGEWLLSIGSQVRPHVVHLNSYVHGALPWTAPVLMVGHSCVLSWWQAVRGETAPDTWSIYRRRVRDGLHNARLVVAPSRAMLAHLDMHYGPFADSLVIPNGRRSEIQVDPGILAAKEPLVLSVGRLWDEAKNVQALDRVASGLSWPILVAGDNAHPAGDGVHLDHVRLLGRLNSSQLARQYAQAAIYALPARYEPFGLSVLEAAMAGCALVLGEIESLVELWGDAAIFVPPDDTATLHAALEILIGDAALRAAMGRRAQQRAMRYTPAAMAAAYWDAYQMLRAEAAVPALHRRHYRPALAGGKQPQALHTP